MMAHIGTQFRNALISAIYRKSLILSPAARQSSSTGQIVNMFANDTGQLQRLMFFLGMIALAPVQIAICLALIYQQVGNATWVGLGLMIILMPVNVFIFAQMGAIRRVKSKVTDSRVKFMNEILAGIRIIKFYAWEDAFIEKVESIREQEMVLLTRLAYIVAIGFSMILLSVPVVQPILVFYTYVRLGNQLDAATAFTTIALFNFIRMPFAFLPMGLAQWSQAQVALKRMANFLSIDEITDCVAREAIVPTKDSSSKNINDEDEVVVQLDDVYLSWIQEEKEKEESKKTQVSKFPCCWKKAGDKSKLSPPTASNGTKVLHIEGKDTGLSKEKMTVVTELKDSAVTGTPEQTLNTPNSFYQPLQVKEVFEDISLEQSIDGEVQATENGVQQYPTYPPSGQMTSDNTEIASSTLGSSINGDVPTNEEGSVAAIQDVPIAAEEVPVNRSVHTLNGISLEVKRGQLLAIVGPVGSGKSSLLSGLSGEMRLNSGKLALSGSVAYCDQRPWILNATVKDNVIFGKPFDADRFDRAVHASCLEDDIAVLPGGVMTEIGERGINLSGGQKARVALARAVYWDADVYLLDDPLSAVDAHVGQHIFEECILKELAGKTRILVTHHVHLLPRCDMVLVLDDGKIKALGSYLELRYSGVDIDAYVPSHNEEEEAEEKDSMVDSDIGKEKVGTMKEKVKKSDVKASKADNRSSNIIEKEEREEGEVVSSAYTYYLKAGGMWLYALLLVVVLCVAGLDLASSFWLSYWSEVTVRYENRGDELSSSSNIYYLNIYALLSMLGVVGIFVRAIILANHRLGTSLHLHSDLLKSVMGSPIAFFDVTPLGRILNRFSTDITTVDEELSQTISQLVNSMLQCVESFAAVAAATQGTFLALLIPLCALYFRIQKYFRRSSTEIQRLQSISLSPIYADFSQALVGVSTIRAYGMKDEFIRRMEVSVDSNTIAAVFQQLASQWLSIRLDMIGAIITLFVAALAAGAGTNFISPGYLGLALTFATNLTTFLKFAVRMIATAEAQMNSVERIRYYAQQLEQEGMESNLLPPPPDNWPTKGTIEARNMSMRYRDGPLVLNQINFDIHAGEKIGIAGRTGSGKSSLMVGLFRIQELSSGTIYIDGVDCSKVPLKILRSRLGIIPQDPVMFSATVRFNLDPFNK